MKIIVQHSRAVKVVDELTIEVLPCYDFIKPHPEIVPEGMFRCFICQKLKGPKHYGDIVFDQKVCKECYPFVTEWGVGCLVKFDSRRGFPV